MVNAGWKAASCFAEISLSLLAGEILRTSTLQEVSLYCLLIAAWHQATRPWLFQFYFQSLQTHLLDLAAVCRPEVIKTSGRTSYCPI